MVDTVDRKPTLDHRPPTHYTQSMNQPKNGSVIVAFFLVVAHIVTPILGAVLAVVFPAAVKFVFG